MATYGEPGKNEFKLQNINGKYSIVVNPETRVSQIYQRISQFAFQSIGTLNLDTNQLTFDENAPLTTDNKSALSKNRNIFRRQSVETASAGGATNAEELLLGNSQPSQSDRSPGQSNDDTSDGSGSGEAPSSTPPSASSDPRVSSENFQSDKPYRETSWLKYPEDMNGTQDRIFIVQKRYKSIVGDSGNIDSVDFLNYNTLSRDRNAPQEEILGSVILPMPNDISETNTTVWGEDSLSTLAGMLGGQATKATAEFGQGDVLESVKTAAQTLGEITGPAREAIQQFLNLRAGAAIVNKFGINFNPEAFRSRITGTAINPNLELLFQGPKLRSFGFQFKMTPRSQDEARNIRYIIKFFKKGMAPKRSESQPFFLGAPNVFDIHFKSKDGDLRSISKIKTCALQQCVVNYTPDGFYAAFEDSLAGGSQPISVTIQLTFTELTPLYNDNYEDSDTVGWDRTSFEYENSPSTPPTPPEEPRSQNPNLPGGGARPGSPVPPIVLDANGRPVIGTPGSVPGV